MEPYKLEPKTTGYKNKFEKEEAYLRAKKKLEKITGFYWHLAVYIVINIFLIILIGVNQSDGEFWDFGTFATAIFWGIGLAFHFLGVFGTSLIFGKNWEERKISEYMERERSEQKRFE